MVNPTLLSSLRGTLEEGVLGGEFFSKAYCENLNGSGTLWFTDNTHSKAKVANAV